MVLGFKRSFIHFLLLDKVLLHHVGNLTLEQVIACLVIKTWYRFPLFCPGSLGLKICSNNTRLLTEPLYILLIKCQRRGGYLVVHGRVDIHSCVLVKYPLLHHSNQYSTHILLLDA